MKTLHFKKSIGWSPLRLGFFLIALVFAWFALSPTAQAQLSPAPDGGYPNNNTAEGDDALFSHALGIDNTATGFEGLYFNNDRYNNTANGVYSLYSNTTGSANTATGFDALQNNTTGYDNTANGYGGLLNNTTGFNNTANGYQALFNNTTGALNTANGVNALLSNTTGGLNTATGLGALRNNTTGSDNTAHGYQALYHNTAGTGNTAEGFKALFSNTGSNNIGLGSNAGLNLTTGGHNIDIGNQGVAAEANTIRIGTAGEQARAFIAGITGATASGGVAVYVNSSGQLGTLTSSARFKQDIHSMDKASEALLALRPVTFRYKHEIDPDGIAQFGLVAEDVEKVNPALVARDAEGKVYTVRYEAVNAMLLNEFLKEHCKVQELEKKIEALTAGLQKVSAQIEVTKPAPQVVNNDQ
jgi:hypothetical protein